MTTSDVGDNAEKTRPLLAEHERLLDHVEHIRVAAIELPSLSAEERHELIERIASFPCDDLATHAERRATPLPTRCAPAPRSARDPADGLRPRGDPVGCTNSIFLQIDSIQYRAAEFVVAQAVPTKCWPCKSNSVRLGSSPCASKRVGGLRAFGRGSGRRASFTYSTPSGRFPEGFARPGKARTSCRAGATCGSSP
jgi:hypothetical protein